MGQPLWGRQIQVAWIKIGCFWQITWYNSKTVQDHFVTSCCGCDVTLRRCLILLCTAVIMYCNYVLYARNNCLKASHNPTISCRRFGFRRFCLSPLWPCLLSSFRHVAVLTFAVLVCRRFDCEPKKTCQMLGTTTVEFLPHRVAKLVL